VLAYCGFERQICKKVLKKGEQRERDGANIAKQNAKKVKSVMTFVHARRSTFHLLAGFFLVLCAGGWILSRFHAVQADYWGRHERIILVLDRGNILCELTNGELEEADFPPSRRWYWGSSPPGGFGQVGDWAGGAVWYHRFGFAAVWARPTQYPVSDYKSVSATTYTFAVPLWLPFLLSLAVTLVLRRRDRQLRLNRLLGRCPECGYDLRATPDRCPECGRVQKVLG